MTIARLVAGYGDAAVAVQKVGAQIESISWMTSDGLPLPSIPLLLRITVPEKKTGSIPDIGPL